jgi:uncharacterized protein
MFDDLWINLPVKDLQTSVRFYDALGFARNPGPGNTPVSASYSVGKDTIILMLFLESTFAGFTQAPVADTHKGTEVLVSLGVASREAVDTIAARVTEAGGVLFSPARASGRTMYGCGFADPDGHRFNVLYMAPAATA